MRLSTGAGKKASGPVHPADAVREPRHLSPPGGVAGGPQAAAVRQGLHVRHTHTREHDKGTMK